MRAWRRRPRRRPGRARTCEEARFLTRRRALAVLALLSPLPLVAAFWPGGAALWLWAAAGSLIPVALIVLATAREGQGLGPLRLPLALLAAALAASVALLLLLPDAGPEAVFGLPLGTAWILFVLVPVPMALVVWAFLAFDRFWLRDEDLERLRQLGRRSAPADGER